jgi:hypothetical protein
MPLHRWRIGASALIAALAVACVAPPAHALRVVTWNLTVYPFTAFPARQPQLRTVMAAIDADMLIAQELNTAAGRDSFLNNVLNVVQPGQWAATTWSSLGSGEGGAVFYKPAKVSVGPASTLVTSGPRAVMTATVTPVGYTAAAATFQIYSIHLKAGGPATVDSTSRRLQCTDIRNILNTLPAGTNFLLGGDSNFYGAVEGGYIRLTESQSDNDGRFKDPLAPMNGNWHANSGYALKDTQCPCNTGCTPGFSGGGMDDRFDIWLTSYSMQDGDGLDYFPDFTVSHGAYPYAYGNDGTKFNNDINAGGSNGMVPIAVANALHDAADHLPVVITLQLPAKVVASASLGFGTVIVGATADQNLSVSNGAIAPASTLNYTLGPTTGFSAPGGAFTADAGAGANSHAIGMSTGSSGAKSGTLAVNSNDVDVPVSNTSLTGTVLDHAASSLDSAAIQVASTVDFGDHAIGQFTDRAVRVHDFGYDPLQARLSVNSANIVGGDGRFSIVGGFTPALLAGTGQTWNVHFNDFGATLDQEYTATLTFSSADEALPGATAAADLVVTLRAKTLSGVAGVPGHELPKVLAFYPPHPNPLTREALFSYDLPAEAPVSLAIYDLSGRRVASLVSGSQAADRYQIRWNAVSEGGARVRAGLYFARFTTPGMSRVSRLIVLP